MRKLEVKFFNLNVSWKYKLNYENLFFLGYLFLLLLVILLLIREKNGVIELG